MAPSAGALLGSPIHPLQDDCGFRQCQGQLHLAMDRVPKSLQELALVDFAGLAGEPHRLHFVLTLRLPSLVRAVDSSGNGRNGRILIVNME